MDKNAIKKYAVWARRELISRVSGRAAWYGITEDSCVGADADSIDGHVLSAIEKKQRAAFISKVQREGYEQAIEEVAYTWFNRFCALRYMEVNGYLPSRVRVFTNVANEFKPQILDEAIHLEIEGLDKEKIFAYKDANDTEGLYRYLLITQCNALSSILPGMFQKIEDYTELLLPENLLRDGNVIERMIVEIPEEDWTDQVQIIGWLYQYYNAEKKDEVFAALKKNIKITKENIPAATQLFTPDWIVRYMVENSLGRLWIEGHPNDDLKSGWKYYLDEAVQEPEVEEQLAKTQKEHASLKPEDIQCIDPCCGSGHILVYMFDVLMQIYESYGYITSEAVISIITNNLYGLDIDERAVQLAYFAVMMKARSYDNLFFSYKIQPHVYSICESDNLDQSLVDYFVGDDPIVKKNFNILIDALHNAKEYGSILRISSVDFSTLYRRIENIKSDISFYVSAVLDEILPILRESEILAKKYDIVITNPPYMGLSEMPPKLANYVKSNYPNAKNDLSTVFMERTIEMTVDCGYTAMINIPVWMFLVRFEKFRISILNEVSFSSLIHLGRGIFGADFGTVSFVIMANNIEKYKAKYLRLFDKASSVDKPEVKAKWFMERKGLYIISQDKFKDITGFPIAYWISEEVIKAFENYDPIGKVGDAKQGLITGNNELFLREWYEVDSKKLNHQWYVYNKGGEYRKWYGNNDLIVNWGNNGDEIIHYIDPVTKKQRSRPQNVKYYFRQGFTWTTLSIGNFSARYMPKGQIFDAKGSSYFADNIQTVKNVLALTNSKVGAKFFEFLSPTVDYSAGSVAKLPVAPDVLKSKKIEKIVDTCIELSKNDWDSFETSWGFRRHPLVQYSPRVSDAFDTWQVKCASQFGEIKSREEELNSIFIDIYDLQKELTPEINDEDITVHKADLQRDVKSLISYAVGCMFGRYSIDVDGLAYAGGEWDISKYLTYQPDNNGILPICDDEYFTDDIVGHFIDFIRTVYGENTLEENLQFIANALGGNGTSREVIRKYFLNGFFEDHCKVYQKRPIYWLFDSGKKNGFKCLIYMHRYHPDTIARIRTDYVHEQQARYRTNIADLENRVETASTPDRIKLTKQLKKVQEQADELHDYEEKIHHLADQFIDIDLDDGVKVNYAKFQDVLAKIK